MAIRENMTMKEFVARALVGRSVELAAGDDDGPHRGVIASVEMYSDLDRKGTIHETRFVDGSIAFINEDDAIRELPDESPDLREACETASRVLGDHFGNPNSPYTPWALELIATLDRALAKANGEEVPA